ncbi:MAG: type VI secretion system contractile sheath large subunit [Pseudomonadota bacterium]
MAADDDLADVLASVEAAEEAPEEGSLDDILGSVEAVEDTQDTDDLDDILGGIDAPEETPEDDDLDDILGSVEAVDDAQKDDDLDGILGSIEAVHDAPEANDLEDILGSVEAVEDTPAGDDLDDILGNIDAPEDGAESDDIDDILGAVEAVDETFEADDLDDILGSVEAAAETPAEDDLDDILGDLDAAEDSEATDDLDDILGSVEAAPDAPAEDSDDTDNLDDILGGLDAPAEDEGSDDLDDILGSVEAAADAEGEDDLDDILGGLDTAEEPAAGDDLDDILGSLDTSDTTDGGDDLDDILGKLDDADETAESDPGGVLGGLDAASDGASDDLDALLGSLDAEEGDTAEDDLDALLGDLDAPAEGAELGGAEVVLGSADAAPAEDTAPEPPAETGPKQTPFGTFGAAPLSAETLKRKKFRIALFGDFTGRAARGVMETGEALAAKQGVDLDVDSVEDIIEGFATTLTLDLGAAGSVDVPLKELDDLHPDEIYDNVAMFEEIAGLRQQLAMGSMAERATQTLQNWGAAHGTPIKLPKRSAATSIPAHLKLTDFQALIGDTRGTLTPKGPADDLIAQVVGPHIVKAPDAGAAAMQEAVDAALSSAMRMILHHPDFQAVEAQWRTLDLLARRIETDAELDITLYDISAEELAADLAAQEDIADSGLCKLLSDVLDPETGAGGYSALCGLYTFEETPPHAELLARIGLVAAHVDAPFIAGMAPGFLETAKEDRHPLVTEAWDALRAEPLAGHLGLVSPRFLLRLPYGKKSEPIDAFEFEEFTPQEGLKGMLWANPAALAVVLLAATYAKDGKALQLGSVMSLGDLPFHYVTDRHGDQVALPCTERNLVEASVQNALGRGIMPVVWMKGRNEVRLGSFRSLGGEMLMGPWTGMPPPQPKPAPEPTPAAEDAAPADDGDGDLDDLLGGLDDDAGGDSDLDDLLGGLDDESGGDDDLDALLSGLDDDAGGDSDLDDLLGNGGDADLDDLLAGFDDDASAEGGDDDDMDPELAALLEGL